MTLLPLPFSESWEMLLAASRGNLCFGGRGLWFQTVLGAAGEQGGRTCSFAIHHRTFPANGVTKAQGRVQSASTVSRSLQETDSGASTWQKARAPVSKPRCRERFKAWLCPSTVSLWAGALSPSPPPGAAVSISGSQVLGLHAK